MTELEENERWKIKNRDYILAYFEIYEKAGGLSYPARIPKQWSPYRYPVKDAMRRYKISAAEAEALIEKKKWGCEACFTTSERLCIDHDHKTGGIRGILCASCNLALGLIKNHPQRIKDLLQYCERIGL